jgi:excisionase family DNA binding protein
LSSPAAVLQLKRRSPSVFAGARARLLGDKPQQRQIMHIDAHDSSSIHAQSSPARGKDPNVNDFVGRIVIMLEQLMSKLDAIQSCLTDHMKPWLTVEEIAELTGRSPFTVRRWITEGRISATRIAGTGPRGRLLVARAELDKLIAEGLGAHLPGVAVDGMSAE